MRLKQVGSDAKGKVREPKVPKTSLAFRNLEAGATYEVSGWAQNQVGKGKRTVIRVTLPAA